MFHKFLLFFFLLVQVSSFQEVSFEFQKVLQKINEGASESDEVEYPNSIEEPALIPFNRDVRMLFFSSDALD